MQNTFLVQHLFDVLSLQSYYTVIVCFIEADKLHSLDEHFLLDLMVLQHGLISVQK